MIKFGAKKVKWVTMTLKMCYQSPMSSDFWIHAWDSSAMPEILHSNQYFRTMLQLGPRTTNKYNQHNSNPSNFVIVLLSSDSSYSPGIFFWRKNKNDYYIRKTTSSVIQILKVKTIVDLSCPISSKYYWLESPFCWN